MIKTEIGPVTAYADAVKAGYTGTREEFARDQAGFAQNASAVANMKQAVEQTVEELHTAAEQAKQDVSDEGDRQVKRIADAAPDLELDRAQIEKNKKAIEGKITNPAGGTSGQVLTKTAGGEEWKDQTGGDVPTKLSDLQEDTTHRTVTDTEKETWNGKYAKPETGIPSSDLAEGVIPDVSKKLTQPSTAQVGQIFKVKSVNEDGTLVLESVDMPSGGVGDVQINGTSIVGENGVAVVPIANAQNYGLVKFFGSTDGRGIDYTKGMIYLYRSSELSISLRKPFGENGFGAITTNVFDYAVKCAMTDGIGTAWTDTEKTGAWQRLSSIKTTMDEVAVAGARYLLGEQTEVTVVLPDDALVGQEVTVAFYNGTTPATLSIMGNMLDFDFAPTANTRSEISALWDGTYWSVIGMSQDVPAEEVVADA